VAYDQTHLYVSFECLEPDPNRIIAVERKYDRDLWDDDYVHVRLDTFHDYRSAYVFTVNALGTRHDMRIGLYGADDSWGCHWEAAASITADRWYVEIAIPIANLLFDPQQASTWGLNFGRSERGIQERSWWSFQDSNGGDPRHFGRLTGLDLQQIPISYRPQIETYVSNTTDTRSGSTKFATGADAAVRLNANLTSAFTLHPDFGQVEADPDTIELRDTERFLDERRPFFREGSELFQTPINIYYTRRFAKIDGGAKMTGQGKDWTLGLVDVYGEINRANQELTGNYNAGRLVHYLGSDSHVGGIWTVADRSNGTNIVGGMDTTQYLDSTTRFSAQALGLYDSLGIETDGMMDNDGYAAIAELSGGTKPLWWGMDLRDISRGFKPDLGFIRRRNVRGPSARLNYRQDFQNSPFTWFRVFADTQLYEDDNHDTILRDYGGRVGTAIHNYIEVWYRRSDDYHAPYHNWSESLNIELNEEIDYWNSIDVGVERGQFNEDLFKEYWINKPQRLTDRLVTEFEGNFRTWDHMDPAEEDEEWLVRSITTYHFTWGSRLKFTAEKTSQGRHNITNLFSWPVNDAIDFYVLYNDYQQDEEKVSEVFVKGVYKVN
jgi:hypothetical protein